MTHCASQSLYLLICKVALIIPLPLWRQHQGGKSRSQGSDRAGGVSVNDPVLRLGKVAHVAEESVGKQGRVQGSEGDHWLSQGHGAPGPLCLPCLPLRHFPRDSQHAARVALEHTTNPPAAPPTSSARSTALSAFEPLCSLHHQGPQNFLVFPDEFRPHPTRSPQPPLLPGAGNLHQSLSM